MPCDLNSNSQVSRGTTSIFTGCPSRSAKVAAISLGVTRCGPSNSTILLPLRPRLTRRQFWGTVVRTVGYTVTALICSAIVHHTDHAWPFAIRVGLVTGVGITLNPFIEYYADNLPERRLGAFGIGLILCGFGLQSLQYWLALFDVRLT